MFAFALNQPYRQYKNNAFTPPDTTAVNPTIKIYDNKTWPQPPTRHFPGSSEEQQQQRRIK